MATKADLEVQVGNLVKELDEMRGAIRNLSQQVDGLVSGLLDSNKKILANEVAIAKLKSAPAPVTKVVRSDVVRY